MHDPKLEHSWISTMASELADVVLEYRVPASVFADDHAASVYEAIVEVATKAKPGQRVTKTLVRRMLTERGLLRLVGGEDKLYAMLSAETSLAFGPMRRALSEYARLRRIRVHLAHIESLATEGRLEATEAAIRELASEAETTDEAAGEHSAYQVGEAALNHYLGNEKRPRRLQVPVLAEAIGRPGPGDLVVIGGQTGAGKSSLALLLAEAYEEIGEPAGIVGMEDPVHIWGERLIARDCSTSLATIERRGSITAQENDSVVSSLERLRDRKSRFALLDRFDHLEVLGKMRRLVTQGCRALFVDYLQVMTDRQRANAPRAVMMAGITADMKAEARRLGVPLFLCSQIRRPETQVRNWEPSMHHLKESGDIENMAEAVILLWKESDRDDAKTLGKVAKLKSGGMRPRFDVIRNHAGAITNMLESREEQQPQEEPKRGLRSQFGTARRMHDDE